MSIILKRPMFRKGGSVAEGTGITSGLTPKRGFVNQPGGYAGEGKEDISDYPGDEEFYNQLAYEDTGDTEDTTPVLTSEKPNIFKALTLRDLAEKDIANKRAADSGQVLGVDQVMSKEKEQNPRNWIDGTQTKIEEKEKIADKKQQEKTQKEQNRLKNYKDEDAQKDLDILTQGANKKAVNPNAVYNNQGEDISQSLVNMGLLARQAMAPQEGQSITSFLKHFAGAGAGEPLGLRTWGSTIGTASEKQAEEDAKTNQEMTKYLGTILGRGVATLGKGATGAGSMATSGDAKKAIGAANIELGRSYSSVQEAIQKGDDEWVNKAREKLAQYEAERAPYAVKYQNQLDKLGIQQNMNKLGAPKDLATASVLTTLQQAKQNPNLLKDPKLFPNGHKVSNPNDISSRKLLDSAGMQRDPSTGDLIPGADFDGDMFIQDGYYLEGPHRLFYQFKKDPKTNTGRFVLLR